VKRSVAGLPPMPSEMFDTKLAALKQQQVREAQNKLSHRCVLCKKTFKNANGYAQHLNTKVCVVNLTPTIEQSRRTP
jgi:hypothetical protein